MNIRNKNLVLNIKRAKQTRQVILKNGSSFSVGQSGDNDLILYGTEYPKKHNLITQKNGSFLVNIKPFIHGEITLDQSTLSIDDLVKHDVLPQQKDVHLLKLNTNKCGYLTVGDTRIDFGFRYIERQKPVVVKSPVYSWSRATLKSMTSDLLFKFIFLVLIFLNAFIIYGLKDYEVDVKKKVNIQKMPERLARFIPKSAEELMESRSDKLASANNTVESENSSKEKSEDKNTNNSRNSDRSSRRRSSRGNPAASGGLLTLIGGSGSGSKSSSIVDALVDKGLVRDLEGILGGGTNLKVSKNGNKDEIDPLDQLIGTGGSGGIDDWLNDMDEEAPQVTLEKKGKVDLAKPSKVTGSSEALGQRTEQSIMQVVLSQRGRITYFYEKYLKRNPNLRGKVSVEFTIAANGFVSSARIIESTVNHPQLERDILNLVKRLKFEAIPSGSITTVFPFQFNKMG